MGKICIYEDYSTIDLPEGMPKDIFNTLKKTRVVGQKLKISTLSDANKNSHSSHINKNRKNSRPSKKTKRRVKK